jgi:pimeloyl-ACP methyl ester carboxylesterase
MRIGDLRPVICNYAIFGAFLWVAGFGCQSADTVNEVDTTDSVISADVGAIDQAIRSDLFVDDAGIAWPEGPDSPERASCTNDHLPIIMVHGFLGAGDTWSAHRRRFIANGLCPEKLYAFDWNSLDQNQDHIELLHTFITGVLAEHEVSSVDLMGHSAGGRLGYDYLADPVRRQTVRRYVHVGSFPNEQAAGPAQEPVPTLNLWSAADLVVEGGDIPGATNVTLDDADHYAVATSAEAFEAVFEFLFDVVAQTNAIGTADPAIISGKFLTFGENQFIDGGVVEVWTVSPESGARLYPAHRFEVEGDGHWGPLVVARDARFEFVGKSPDPAATDVRHFFESFNGDKGLTYLRGFPGPGSLAGALTVLLPKTESQTTLVIYNGRGSFLAGRDTLTLNGQELLNEQTAPAENTSIALFVFDIDGDGATGGSSPIFDMFPFLAAVDQPLPVSDTTPIELIYNGRTITLPSEPATDGIFVAIFD